ARVDLDQARDLRQPDDAASRDVRHVGTPEERQDVVLAERVEVDVLHHDHLGVLLVEQGAVDDGPRVLLVAPRAVWERARHALRRLHEPLAAGLGVDLTEQLRDDRLEVGFGHGFGDYPADPAPATSARTFTGRALSRRGLRFAAIRRSRASR